MLEITLTFEDGTRQVHAATPPVSIGRAPQCAVRIANWRVGRQHARLLRQGGGIVLEDLGTLSGTLVNGERVATHGPLQAQDRVLIGPCQIQVRDMTGASQSRETHAESDEAAPAAPVPIANQTLAALAWLPHRRSLHAALLQALDLRRRDVAGMSDQALREEARRLLDELVDREPDLPEHLDRTLLCRMVLDEAVGLGPLETLLADPGITEIMVNRHDEVYVERSGQLSRHDTAFSSEQAVRGVIDRIVAPLGRRIDESSPMVDARLPDGSRVNAVIPPIALRGASLTIRKFPVRRLHMPDLVGMGSLSEAMAELLALCVRRRKSIIVSGGTGSGKTTLLNILSNAIPEGERIVTIEDAAELRLGHAHLVSLEARPPNLEGRGRVEIRDLVRNALRMRPDRIVVGECRGAEAFDMLTAMNTGHEGSLTTLHANSPRDALSRLEAMTLMAGLDLPLAVVREHIASSVDIVVQQARLAQGQRVVTDIVEVTGMESGRIQLQDLFRYEPPRGFVDSGMRPVFMEGALP
ncbi:MAG: ATPase, T2SS/T4P/T4SS family [Bordetella sp.]|uniref:ATPase, T2SS/T4P/T4SS family n=1 Tax=Bordetella sp. TaxID=28081 RepID=UPI003F7B3946